MAKQLVADFYDCGDDILTNIEFIKITAHKIVGKINSHIVNETHHLFEPVGITYMAIIAKSHLAIHTWPEKKTVALDIFSCEDDLPADFLEEVKADFQASSYRSNLIERSLTK